MRTPLMAKKDDPSAPLYEIRNSSIHARGIFAAQDLRKGQAVMQYIGERITKEESERRSIALIEKAQTTGEGAVYIFALNDEWDIDGAEIGNDAKLINHSCDPNCEALIEDDEIWIYALRKIRKGEELSYNYGFDLETWEDHPCQCGSKRCVGFIVAEEHWKKLKKKMEKRLEKALKDKKKRLAKEKEKAKAEKKKSVKKSAKKAKTKKAKK
ncbi:MAG: SET domain-containing protein-lysine N-methyltransferase [Verrucomicrobiales bacterium]|nr:SET domain-containing protein-lysine N-methyltransferase [Verrucomicrobiales bacterium]